MSFGDHMPLLRGLYPGRRFGFCLFSENFCLLVKGKIWITIRTSVTKVILRVAQRVYQDQADTGFQATVRIQLSVCFP